jgi:hypothetical protein
MNRKMIDVRTSVSEPPTSQLSPMMSVPAPVMSVTTSLSYSKHQYRSKR